MRRVRINAKRPYDVVVGAGVTDKLTEELKRVFKGRSCVIITDETVSGLCGQELTSRLTRGGIKSSIYAFSPGEGSKSLQTLGGALDHMCARGLTATDFVLALGGGIPGDVGGFAAAVYKRGIGFASVPTTLLSMVDASVGGKTAINLPAGKNLAGAFWQPSLVICDTDRLSSLPERDYKNGMAEVIKYGVLRDRELFSMVSGGEKPDPEEMITRCVSHKAYYVETDERDARERRKLNLGHTIGHAIELASAYSVTHGEAVSIGLAVVARASENMGVAEKGTAAAISQALENNGLPTKTDIPAAELLSAMTQDKKRGGTKIDLILPVRIGKCVIRPIPFAELPELLRNGSE